MESSASESAEPPTRTGGGGEEAGPSPAQAILPSDQPRPDHWSTHDRSRHAHPNSGTRSARKDLEPTPRSRPTQRPPPTGLVSTDETTNPHARSIQGPSTLRQWPTGHNRVPSHATAPKSNHNQGSSELRRASVAAMAPSLASHCACGDARGRTHDSKNQACPAIRGSFGNANRQAIFEGSRRSWCNAERIANVSLTRKSRAPHNGQCAWRRRCARVSIGKACPSDHFASI